MINQVCHIITSLNDGGAEAVLYRLCSYEKTTRHHVISLMDEGKYGPLLQEMGVKVTCLNMPQGKITVFGLWKLWCILRNERSDVIQTWMYHANLIGGVLARLAGAKKIFWGIHHTTLDSNKRSTFYVAKLCAWLSTLVPTGIVCCAQKSLEVHRDLGYVAHKLFVIPNGYDLNRFSFDAKARQSLRTQWGVGEKWLLGMVSRFDPQKDHKNLLMALARLKHQNTDFYAVLVGNGLDEENRQIKEWLVALGLTDNIRLLGRRNDIPDVMSALDVHVLSSSSGEAFPNVVAEAMACETPVVVTDVGDAATIVGDTGWVVPPKSADMLANALLKAREAMQDTDAWQMRCTAARQRVENNFSLQRMVEGYKHVWSVDK